MRTVSDLFVQAVRSDHKAIARVDVLSFGTVVASLPVVSGSVTLDRTATVRGRCDLTIADLVPATAAALLAPYGNEVAVLRGIEFGDGTQEWVQLGIFRIDSAESVEPGRSVHVIGQDRSATVSDARLEAPYSQPAGANYATAIQALISAGVSGLGFQLRVPTHVTPLIVVQEQADRWQTAQGWAQAYGDEIYFDGDGLCVSHVEPEAGNGPVVFAINEGVDGVLVDVATNWARTGMYNRVIATGSNPGSSAIYRGVATDNDPTSPTFYGGKFGKVPYFFASPLISSSVMAAASATSTLARVIGLTQAVRFESVVLPFLEPGDIINVIRSTLPINDSPHLIETLTIPLESEGRMSGTTRTRQGILGSPVVVVSGPGTNATATAALGAGVADDAAPDIFDGIIDRGTSGASSGATTSLAAVSASFTPDIGSVLIAFVNSRVREGGPHPAVLSDTFGDSGGTAWVETVFDNTNASTIGPNGSLNMQTAIWTRKVGSGPVAGTVTAETSADTTTAQRSIQMTLVEWGGSHTATPIQTAHDGNLTTSLTLTFGSAPLSSSRVFALVNQEGTSVTSGPTGPVGMVVIVDSGWQSGAPGHWVGYLGGGGSSSMVWTAGGGTIIGLQGCVVEIG